MEFNKYILLLLSGMLFCSCSFLEEDIRSSSQKDSYYQTEEQIISGLDGCYMPLRNIYGNSSYFVITECQADIIYESGTGINATLEGLSPSNPSTGTSLWTNGYLGVMRCNAIIAAIERSSLAPQRKNKLHAEAAILRAFSYYILTCNFGDVPYYTEEVTDENNTRITHLGRMSASDIRNTCIDELYDLLITQKILPFAGTYATDNEDRYRVGAAVGLMLAGKMCLWEERWADAIEIFGYLEDIYGNGKGNPAGALDAYPLSDIPFYNKYVAESIFEVPNIYLDYGLRITSSLAASCTPQRMAQEVDEDDILADDEEMEEGTDYVEGENTDYYNGIAIPWLGGNSRTTSPARPCVHFYKELMPATSAYNDKRRAAYNPGDGKEIPDGGGYLAWGWQGWAPEEDRTTVPAHWMFFTSTKNINGRPFLGNKFWCPGMQYNMDSNNYKVFRFAGVLLGLAEAHLRKGDEEMACAYLNAVKSRAGIKQVGAADFSDPEELMEEIRSECARELFGEFQRKHDLVRWGVWFDYVLKYSDKSALKKHARPCHRYYPIPEQEIIYSGGNLDNNEYNQYGL